MYECEFIKLWPRRFCCPNVWFDRYSQTLVIHWVRMLLWTQPRIYHWETLAQSPAPPPTDGQTPSLPSALVSPFVESGRSCLLQRVLGVCEVYCASFKFLNWIFQQVACSTSEFKYTHFLSSFWCDYFTVVIDSEWVSSFRERLLKHLAMRWTVWDFLQHHLNCGGHGWGLDDVRLALGC